MTDCKIILIGQRCYHLYFVLFFSSFSCLVSCFNTPLVILCRVVQTLATVQKLKKYSGKLGESKCYATILCASMLFLCSFCLPAFQRLN